MPQLSTSQTVLLLPNSPSLPTGQSPRPAPRTPMSSKRTPFQPEDDHPALFLSLRSATAASSQLSSPQSFRQTPSRSLPFLLRSTPKTSQDADLFLSQPSRQAPSELLIQPITSLTNSSPNSPSLPTGQGPNFPSRTPPSSPLFLFCPIPQTNTQPRPPPTPPPPSQPRPNPKPNLPSSTSADRLLRVRRYPSIAMRRRRTGAI